eukprot:3586843-Rhodomonas_salina.2
MASAAPGEVAKGALEVDMPHQPQPQQTARCEDGARATHLLCDVRNHLSSMPDQFSSLTMLVISAIRLRACYAMPSTNLAFGASSDTCTWTTTRSISFQKVASPDAFAMCCPVFTLVAMREPDTDMRIALSIRQPVTATRASSGGMYLPLPLPTSVLYGVWHCHIRKLNTAAVYMTTRFLYDV